ncbi:MULTISPECIES: polysaccharide pyruvyl transferase family protein [unclassified Adlercreutzia]|uniref:polysaccharide pyruvyl transferase family protein n=1 Tax=unclassified Adlercreutzia TaxID=2636013 RepID=UPI0013EDC9E0|nr:MULTISPECIES: polysaccharide pyruvyl transferase family protein [unclassified Adlercreutzia]
MGCSVGVVTYHKSLSYGGCLQAFATMEVIRRLGGSPFFVDYENPYEARAKSSEALRHGSPRQRVAVLAKRLLYNQKECHRRAFSSFAASLPLSEECCKSIDGLDTVEADALLVGSDQVWNPKITGGIDPVFFLQFGKAKRRVSFASSVGSYQMGAEELSQVASYLSRFTSICVREDFAKGQIQPLVDVPVHVGADPTLQLHGDEWRRFAEGVDGLEPRSYILVFSVASTLSRLAPMIRDIKGALHLPIVQVRLNSKKPALVDHVIPATPFELVWLIDNAAHVLTDSFHGLAFSINMETSFTLLPNEGNNVRLLELARLSGLSSRMRQPDERSCAWEEIDFSVARESLTQRRAEDKVWLSSALGFGENGV